MKAGQWSTVSKPLAAVLPDFEPFKKGFIRRHEWVAECFYADSSSYSPSAFYLEAFALPLFVPSDHLYFTYGTRIGTRWDDVTDDLVHAVEACLPSLQELATLDGLVRSAERPHVDVYHAEVHLCVALIRGDEKRFHDLANTIAAWKEQVAWQRAIIDRCAELTRMVRAEGDKAGVRMLHDRVPGVLALVA